MSPVPACLPRHAACIANVSPFFFALVRTGSLHFVSAARRANVWEACACVRVNVRNMAAMTSSAACWSTATSLPGCRTIGQRCTRHTVCPRSSSPFAAGFAGLRTCRPGGRSDRPSSIREPPRAPPPSAQMPSNPEPAGLVGLAVLSGLRGRPPRQREELLLQCQHE